MVKATLQVQRKVMLNIENISRDTKNAAKHSARSNQVAIEQFDREIVSTKASKRQLYERYRNGLLDKDEYLKEREAVQSSIDEKLAVRNSPATHITEQDEGVDRFFSSILPHPIDTELSAEMINTMVKAVHVFADDRIEVTFSFSDELEQALRSLNET